jgi:putative toxin-antitoxin system antitoxin component (TIGR02293 family)
VPGQIALNCGQYAYTRALVNAIATAAALGGAAVLGIDIESEVELVQLVEEGLPIETLDRLMAIGDLRSAELEQIIPRRTISHLKAKGRLSPEQSDRVARAASVFALAHEVFANRDKANHWMRQPNRALQGATPLSLLRTGSGAQLVETILTRIAYGVYS